MIGALGIGADDVLMVRLAADASGLKRDLEEAKQSVGDWRSSLNGLFAGATAGAAIAWLGSLTKGAIAAADQLGDLASKVGVSAEFLSKHKLAAELSGASLEALGVGTRELSKNIFAAASGNQEMAATFKGLGIDTRDATGAIRSADAVLMDLAKVFEGLPDGPEKTAIAMQLMGKRGTELIPTLSNGAEGLEQYAATAKALGLVLDKETIAAADRTNDNFVILGKATEGLGNVMMKNLLPSIESGTAGLVDFLKTSGIIQAFGDAASGALWLVIQALKGVAAVGMSAWGVIRELGTGIGAVAAAIVRAVQGDFRGAVSILKDGMDDLGRISRETDASILKLWADTPAEVKKGAATVAASTDDVVDKTNKAKKAADEYAKAAKTVQELTAKASGVSGDYVEKLRQLELWYSRNRGQTEQYVRAVEELIRQQPSVKEGLKAQEEAQKAANKAAEEAIALDEKQRLEVEARIRKAREMVEGMRFEIDALAMTNVQREIAIKLRELEKAGIERGSAAYEHFARQIREAVISREAIQQNIKAQDEIAKAWDKTTEQMGQSLADWIMQGGKNAGDYIRGLFRSMVLTPLLRPVLQAGVGAVGSLLGLAPGAAAANGGAGGLGLLGGGLGALGSFAQTGLMNTLFGTGTLAGLDAAGALMSGGNLLGGLGMGLGTVAPWIAGAAAVAALAKSLFGSKGGPKVGGSFESAPFFGGDRWVTGAGKLFSETQQDAQAADLARSWQQALAATAAALGGNAAGLQYGLGFAADPAGSAANRVAGFVGTSYFNDADVGRTEEAMQAAIARTMAQMTLAGLQQSDLPAVFAEYFRRIDLAGATEEQVQAAIAAARAAQQMADAVNGLGGVFTQVAGLSVEARNNILSLTGGLDAFVQKVGGYVSAFYSPEEQAAIQARSIAQALAGAGVDITGLDSKAEFRALVDALDLSSDTGQAQLAALLNVAQGFAGLADYMAEQGVTLEDLAAMAPVDRLAELTAAGQRTQESQLASIDGRLQAVEAALGQVVGAVQASAGAIGGAVAAAVQDVAARPVVVAAPEVNGGWA